MEGSKVGLLEVGRAQEGASRVGEAGWSLANTGKNSRKYPACQLLCWYRSNELWKNRRKPHRQNRRVGRPRRTVPRAVTTTGGAPLAAFGILPLLRRHAGSA